MANTPKLTPQQKLEIRAARGKVNQKTLAKRYGVSQAAISYIQSVDVADQRLKFSDDEVRAIRASKKTYKQTAFEYGCAYMTVYFIKSRRSRKNVLDFV
jgi:predicted transcriptional regulator